MINDTTAPQSSGEPVPENALRKTWSVPLGELYVTCNAVERVPHHVMLLAIARHCSGDWGDVCEEEWQANNKAMADGFRLLSAFSTPDGVPFWIITECDHSKTTVLLPDDN